MRVVIADDALIVRVGLSQLLAHLGHQVVDEVDDAARLPALVAAHAPDLVVTDIRMPPFRGQDGLVAAEHIRNAHPDVAVLVLSQYLVPGFVSWLLDRSPSRTGYLLKDHLLDPGTLADALDRLDTGDCVVDQEVTAALLRQSPVEAAVSLTARERDVLALMAQGRSDRGIAEQLSVSLNTIGTHISRIFRKLEIPDTEADNRRVHAVLRWLDAATSAPIH